MPRAAGAAAGAAAAAAGLGRAACPGTWVPGRVTAGRRAGEKKAAFFVWEMSESDEGLFAGFAI